MKNKKYHYARGPRANVHLSCIFLLLANEFNKTKGEFYGPKWLGERKQQLLNQRPSVQKKKKNGLAFNNMIGPGPWA